ncbi:MAG TPA: hypothetical protein VFF63_07405 [Candidatus Babeliales bacterium]|nr:hypothetical protein [Candidatus Babeliales bacterium]
MMASAFAGNQRMGRATLASLGIHCAVALAIPALAWTASTSIPVETVSFSRILHVEIVPPRAPHPPPRAIAPHHSPKTAINFTGNVRTVSLRPHRRATPEPVVASNAPAAPAVGAVQRAGTGSALADAAPNATTSPAIRSVASVGSRQPGGYLPFGAEQPEPVLDPSVRKELDALGAHVTLVVTVGDDGRTESVDFEPPIDPALETRIRSLLSDASWDPAVCGGGVACEGRATIKL